MFRPSEQNGRVPPDVVEEIETTLRELDRLGREALALAVMLDRSATLSLREPMSDNRRQPVVTLFGDGRPGASPVQFRTRNVPDLMQCCRMALPTAADIQAEVRLDAEVERVRRVNAAVGEAFRLDVAADRAKANALRAALVALRPSDPAS
jgi:hypothetical protein